MSVGPEAREALWALFLVVTVVAFFLADSYDLPDSFPHREFIGGFEDLSVSIVNDAARGGVVMVKLKFQPETSAFQNGLLTPARARELANVLRVAASPGRTLAEARFNHRHGGHSSVEVTGRPG